MMHQINRAMLAGLFLLAVAAPVWAQANFFQGKTIKFVVGYQSGDSHDMWARAYTRHMGKHIPGNPAFIVQNMTGAGSLVAANYIYNVAKPGGLMSYAPSQADLWRRAADFVGKILKGAKPADIPVEQPMKFEFIVNLNAAKQIGVTIPPNVLVRADKVIR